MKTSLGRVAALTLVSVLALLSFAAPTGAQDPILNRPGRSPGLRKKTRETHKGNITGASSSYEVLYSFCSASNCADGSSPTASLIRDTAGNLYGTTSTGGDLSACNGVGCGTVFKLDTTGNETVLYAFTGGTDGATPQAGVIHDAAGNLYGTTSTGGDLSACNGVGCGAVFKLDTTGHETVIYAFTGGADGFDPVSGVIQDAAGNLYGTTEYGGDLSCNLAEPGCGVVFKLDTTGKETVLYTFTGGADGANPHAGVIRDAAGNLYGTAELAGDLNGCPQSFGSGCGVVFKLDATGHETVLYTFTGGADGLYPAGVIQDAAGNLYGTTLGGGDLNSCVGQELAGCGVVFKLDTTGKETVLYTFTGGADGANPQAGVIQDVAGNLYGTTFAGGANNDGTLFKLDSTGQEETVLYSFCAVSNCADGSTSNAGLIQDIAGNLYGTTSAGGANSEGTVFRLAPLITPTVTVTPSGSSITTAQALDVTVAVNGGIGNPAPTGTVTLISGSFTSAATILSSGSATINIPAGSLVVGTDTLTASYSGDSNYAMATGTSSVTVTAATPSFTVDGTPVSVSPGSITGNTSAITVTPSGGFTGSVALTATITSSPAGAQDLPTLSFGSTTPVSITSVSTGMATLTISTTAASSAAVAYPVRPGTPWHNTGWALGFALVFFLLGIPARGRNCPARLVFSVILTGSLLACGCSSSSGGAGGTGNPGTTPGTYTVTVTGTSGSTTATGTVTLTVGQ
jgi:uncharacterized repeat protein (TIGR03803 family)